MEIRRVQETGKGTLIVSLPKKWSKKLGIKKGSNVILEMGSKETLIIRPVEPSTSDREKRISLNAGEIANFDDLVREIISYYLAGYDVIEIIYPRSELSVSKRLKEFIKAKLIGLEVVEESSNHIVFKNLVKHNELPLNSILERMGYTVLYMVQDAIYSLFSPEENVAKSVLERDDEVDRFYFYAVRQLKQVLSGEISPQEIGLSSLESALDFRLLVKSLERMGDHAARIAGIAINLSSYDLKNVQGVIDSYSRRVIDIVKETLTLIMDRDREKAHRLIDRVKELQNLERDIISIHLREFGNDPVEASDIRMVVDSLRRIADYSADIAETIINAI